MPTFFNKLSVDELLKFKTNNPNLTASQLAELSKDKVDLNGFTSEQIRQYNAGLAAKQPAKNPPNPPNPANPPNPTMFGQPKAESQILPEPEIKPGKTPAPPHREPFAPSGKK